MCGYTAVQSSKGVSICSLSDLKINHLYNKGTKQYIHLNWSNKKKRWQPRALILFLQRRTEVLFHCLSPKVEAAHSQNLKAICKLAPQFSLKIIPLYAGNGILCSIKCSASTSFLSSCPSLSLPPLPDISKGNCTSFWTATGRIDIENWSEKWKNIQKGRNTGPSSKKVKASTFWRDYKIFF